MLGNKLLNIRFAKFHIWNNKSEGFPNMVLSTETFNHSVRTEDSKAVNARYTFQPLRVSGINEQLSSKKTITCGVPQGSILGLLLFLLYINDLPECLRSTTPCMYADDTQIFSSSYDANELVIKLNSDLAHVRNWLIENKLQMHPSKSKLMFIGSSYNLNNKNTEQPVVVNNVPVPRTDTHKCLGVQIDEKLSWDSHIDMICKKASAGMGAMRRIKPFVPVDTLEKVYKRLVQLYFEYCSPL